MDTKLVLKYLKISCFLIFIGRAYQHLFWDAPFRSLLWDQNLLEPLVDFFFNMNWKDYVTNLSIDKNIQFFIKAHGFLYAICAVISLFIKANTHRIFKIIIAIGSFSLILLSLLQTKEKFYHFAMFFEHAIQFGAPILLLYFLKTKSIFKLIIPLKLIIAVAFTCHGLYAIGTIYPLPANFVTMTLNILPINEPNAKTLLLIAGILDFAIAICLFIPKLAKPFLLYATIWGLATAFARILSGFTYDISLSNIHQYLYLTVYRIPHGLIPLLLYLILKTQQTSALSKSSYF